MILDFIIQLVLSPVLVVQAVRTRASAMWLPEPPGDRSGVVGQGPVLRLLILGDSAAAGVGAPTQGEAISGLLVHDLAREHRVEFDVVARTGARTVDALPWLDDLPRATYDYVLISLGVNDVTKGVLLPRWIVQQRCLIDHLVARYGARRVIITGLPPMDQFPLLPNPMRWVVGRRARRFDQAMIRLTGLHPAAVRIPVDPSIDPTVMAADGFHPGPTVHAEWARRVGRVIRDDLDARAATP